MEIDLTKDSHKVLVLLYKEYLEKVKSGCSKLESRTFDGNNLNFITKMHPDDIDDCLTKLNENNLIDMNIAGEFELTDIAIVKMENRFKNSLDILKDVASFIAQFL